MVFRALVGVLALHLAMGGRLAEASPIVPDFQGPFIHLGASYGDPRWMGRAGFAFGGPGSSSWQVDLAAGARGIGAAGGILLVPKTGPLLFAARGTVFRDAERRAQPASTWVGGELEASLITLVFVSGGVEFPTAGNGRDPRVVWQAGIRLPVWVLWQH